MSFENVYNDIALSFIFNRHGNAIYYLLILHNSCYKGFFFIAKPVFDST